MLIRKQSGEVIEVDTEEIMEARDFAALIGREDDPVVTALVAEIRRLGTVLGNQGVQLAPVVNVTPSFTPPSVNVSPQVSITAPTRWHVSVKRYEYGRNQGQIESVDFIAMQP